MYKLTCLDNRPRDWFPPTKYALDYPNGLLAFGGDLHPDRILAAYSQGIFPWPLGNCDQVNMLWWSPDPRMVLYPDAMKVHRSVRKRINRGQYSMSYDSRFDEVIRCCAYNRFRDSSWITAEVIKAYTELHRLGYAHSVEVLSEDTLVGGLYGITQGGVFFGESMFSIESDVAKIALYYLCQHLLERNYCLIDCQVESPFLASLGATLVTRNRFEQRLNQLVELDIAFADSC